MILRKEKTNKQKENKLMGVIDSHVQHERKNMEGDADEEYQGILMRL